MKTNKLLAASVLTAALGISWAQAHAANSSASTQATPISAEQKQEIQRIIHDYLVTNPEVLMEASHALQQKQQEIMQAQAKSAIAKHGSALVNGNLTVAGNPKGNVTLVEFFDLQCSHCMQMKPIVNELIKDNPNLRVVFKEFPIFGKESEMASRAAIVAAMQGKYLEFQEKIYAVGKRLDEATIMAVAKEVGLNMHTLKTDMESKAVTDILDANHELGEQIHLMGTPAFILLATHHGHFQAGSETMFVPGAASKQALQDMITKLSKNDANMSKLHK